MSNPKGLSALEPAAPEDHKAASAASVDPDGIWERAYAETAGVQPDDETNQGKEGFCYRDENGKVQFQQTAPAANETRRGKSRGEPHKHGPNDEPGSLAAEQSGETSPAAPEGQQPVAYRVHAPADEHYGIGPDRLQFHPLAQYDLDNGYRQTPLYTRPSEQAVTEALTPLTIWANDPDISFTLQGSPGACEALQKVIQDALKAAMEAGRQALATSGGRT